MSEIKLNVGNPKSAEDGQDKVQTLLHITKWGVTIPKHIFQKYITDGYIDPFNMKLNRELWQYVGEQGYTSVSTIPRFIPGNTFTLGSKQYICDRKVGKGGYGTVYKAINKSSGECVALKYQSPARVWEWHICKEVHKRLTDETVRAAFMQISDAVVSPQSSAFVSRYSNLGSLHDLQSLISYDCKKHMPEIVVMSIASQLLSAIEHLHRCQIIHGDLKPDNILMLHIPSTHEEAPYVQLIDFGCAIDMSLYPAGTQFLRSASTHGFTCAEMKEGRPWSYQTDLYCMAATVYYALFGVFMKVTKAGDDWRITKPIPRYYQKTVWYTFFDQMINIQDIDNLPNLTSLKEVFDGILTNNKQLCADKFRIVRNALKKA